MTSSIWILGSWGSRVATESGIKTIAQSCRNTKILCLQRFVRLSAYGASCLVLAHFLSGLGLSDDRIGLFMTLTLLGDAVISSLLTVVTDQVGRRWILSLGAVSMAVSGLVFAISTNYWILLVASVVGVISPSGSEIGPFRAVEESILAQLTAKEVRSDVFAWYTLFGTAGAALGALTSGWLVQALQETEGWDTNHAYRAVFAGYGVLGLVKLLLVLCLASGVELESAHSQYQQLPTETGDEAPVSYGSVDEGPQSQEANEDADNDKPSVIQRIRSLLPHISPMSRSILYRLLLLFILDSFASGMASQGWVTYFFTTVHSLEPSTLGNLFFVSNILATLSNLFALPIVRRIGPLKTMVFTHLPSTLFLASTAVPPAGPVGTWLAMTFLSLGACTKSMDQAPRQAFLSAAVLPGERTAVLGVVNVVKTLAQAGGIGSTGVLASRGLWLLALGGAGAMKASYDLLMLWMFLHLPDREQ
ncbi:major facilitator superfamily domain-containing protein [Podospora aff. communis PSN243]|uniref:Major facilitator superfamily domain-containing protein n=1 Tax=Podospora aff. communis PSN243 TaxID=3040156 RepID=A0AAV9GG02_9PEZI|nr:major facilitator superfamily domain-containing protein [Podospora aff. communis PSN243]